MKVSLLIGVVLLLVGLVTALTSVAGVGEGAAGASSTMVMPITSGLALAVGALFVGLGMGNWRHPRSHEEPGDAAVNPEGHHKMKHV